MLRRRPLNAVTAILVALWIASILVAGLQAQKSAFGKKVSISNSKQGQRTFMARCAGCHGLDGRGGERAPNITGSAKLQRLSDAEISGIVSNGVPGTGMPAFRSLGATGVHAVVSYLRFLQGQSQQGQNKAQIFPGDPARGKTIFFGKAECSSCHMIQGKGGFLGQDLSTYGSTRPAKEILDVITDPAKNIGLSQKSVVAVTRDRHTISGLVRNEDNFSVQILTSEGVFYSFPRSDLQSLDYQDRPVMPSDYSERLSRDELNDLLSYLMSVGRMAKPDPAVREED